MLESDFPPFSALLDDVWSLKATALSASQKAMYFRALAEYPLAQVRAGLDGHIKSPDRGRFLPMPGDIIAQIDALIADDGRPDAEEAWALSFRALDEGATVVWTSEMAEAYGTVKPLLDAGDEVGARMAFKSSYARLVAEARALRARPAWSASLGHSKTEQAQALKPHVALGRLPASMLQLAEPSMTLLELSKSPDAPAKARQALLAVREQILARKEAPGRDFTERLRTDCLKAASADAVEQYESKLRGVA